MKFNFLFGLLTLTQALLAQSFTEVPPAPSFDGVWLSSIAFADVNGDGHEDVLITGEKEIIGNEPIAKLYLNDGMGHFSEVTDTPFEGVWESSIAFADVNGDGHEDVLITGAKDSFGNETIAKLYLNDGMGHFSEVTDTPFEGVWESSIAFADVNGDGHNDVLITGAKDHSGNEPIAKLYLNDGTGHFSEMTDTPFEDVWASSIAFADVNGDGHEDVLITGAKDNAGNERIAKLYTNDGMGHFSEVTDTPFEGVWASSIAFADVNGDGHNDVLITGQNNSDEEITKLYTNDGTGHFSEMTDTPFEDVWASSIAFADVNGDGHKDVLITGTKDYFENERIAKLYLNDGMGHFSEVTDIPFDGVDYSSIAFSDVDGDGHEDVLITGRNSSNKSIAKLYTNDGMGHFSKAPGTPFEGVWSSSIAFADVNGDGHNDVLITGAKDQSGKEPIAKLYLNDGTGHFSEVTDTPFDGVWDGSIAFADVNGDGHEDVLITGTNSSHLPITKLYTNDGMGHFSEVTDTPFDDVGSSSIAFADVNGDGHKDVLITGEGIIFNGIAKLYLNDGMGHFSEVADTPFAGVRDGSIAFADVNGDGHEDVLITGLSISFEGIAKLYLNDGMGHFSEVTDTPFEGVWDSSIAFSDVNGDGHEDVLITGSSSSNNIAKLYTNDGMGHFSEVTDTPFEGVWSSSIAFADVNGDGHEDVLITGAVDDNVEVLIAKLYLNDGMGHFSEVMDTPFDGVWDSSIAFADVNGDGHEDVLITGAKNYVGDEKIAKLYTNDGGAVSTFDDLTLGDDLNFTLFPNPIRSNELYINFLSPENGTIRLSVYDLNGRLIQQQKTSVVSGPQLLSMDIGSLPPASYFIHIDNGKRKGVARFTVY